MHTLVTSSGANAGHSGTKFNFFNQSTDTEQIWSSLDIQGVIGLTPHSEHFLLVKSALKSNKPLFIEKPICTQCKEHCDVKEEENE